MASRLDVMVVYQAMGHMPNVHVSLELFHSSVLSTVQKGLPVCCTWGLGIRTLHHHYHVCCCASVAQCHEGDFRAGLGQMGFPNTVVRHCLIVHTLIMLATRVIKGNLVKKISWILSSGKLPSYMTSINYSCI